MLATFFSDWDLSGLGDIFPYSFFSEQVISGHLGRGSFGRDIGLEGIWMGGGSGGRDMRWKGHWLKGIWVWEDWLEDMGLEGGIGLEGISDWKGYWIGRATGLVETLSWEKSIQEKTSVQRGVIGVTDPVLFFKRKNSPSVSNFVISQKKGKRSSNLQLFLQSPIELFDVTACNRWLIPKKRVTAFRRVQSTT